MSRVDFFAEGIPIIYARKLEQAWPENRNSVESAEKGLTLRQPCLAALDR